ncbi:MAG: DNA polymerase III subunit beta [Clostridiales bacterium]|nr:DNA polymerase III subunit beta [Clostridiales bacterium]
MKFSVETNELNEALAVVTKALSPNVETPILKGIFVSTFGSELFLKCSDSSVQIETLIPAMVEEDGSLVLPGRLTADLVRRMKGQRIEFETGDNNSMKVETGRSRSSLQYFSAETYPQMDEVRSDITFNIKQNVFRSMIKQTAFCCAGEDEGKAILRGVLMEFTEEGELNLVALDGFRLAKRTEKVSVNGEKRNAVVPARTMQDIANILSDTEDEITVTLSATHITVNMGTTKIKARLLKGEYINYRNILSKKSTSKVVINRAELLESLEIASLFSKETQNNLIKLDFDNEQLKISAKSETGSINESTPINLIGSPIEIAFNAKYLLDIIKAIDDDEIALSFNTSVTPCVAEPVHGDKFYYLVLPVRLMRN